MTAVSRPVAGKTAARRRSTSSEAVTVAASGRDQYDEYDAKVRVPKGEKLAKSRDTPGAHRGFVHGGERRMEHAEIFLKPKGDEVEQADGDPTTGYIYESARAPKTRAQLELEERLQELVQRGMYKAVDLASPYVERWWHEQARPFMLARSERVRHRLSSRRRLGESSAVLVGGPVGESQDVVAALDTYKASITSDEARRHFVQALMTQRYVDDKRQLLTEARIEDSDAPAELAAAVQALTPKQVEDCLIMMLETNPGLPEDLGQRLRIDTSTGSLQPGTGDHDPSSCIVSAEADKCSVCGYRGHDKRNCPRT